MSPSSFPLSKFDRDSADQIDTMAAMEAASLLPQLKKFWGYDSFRPLQAEAIDCVLRRRDSVTAHRCR